MTYSMTKIRKIKWGVARFTAHKVLLDHSISDFPIDIISIIKSHPDLKLTTYRKMSEKQGLTIEEVIFVNSSPDGCIHYDANKRRYFIAYNDEIENKERMYWTLAHEFGHYILDHLKETGRSSMTRNDLSDAEYNLYEKEADYFTRFLINPPFIIKEWNHVTYERVMSIFKVSYTAANNTLRFISGKDPNVQSLLAPGVLKKQLAHFIQKVNVGKHCSNCNSFFVLNGSNYCPICGYASLTHFFKGDDCNVRYPGHEVSPKGKALKCPRCSNEVIYLEGDFCPQCGVLLVNKCTNTETDINGYVLSECLQVLPGNSRYCHACGFESTFLVNRLLYNWELVKEDYDREKLPF